MGNMKQYCTFFVDNLFLAIDVLEVQEVIRYQEMTQVPTAPRVVRGLINLRADRLSRRLLLRERLGLPPSSADKKPMNVVIPAPRTASEPLGGRNRRRP